MNINDNRSFLVCVRCFTFNHAPYIEDALRGFAMQETTFPTVYVIVDDASTDGEVDVLKKWVGNNLALSADSSLWKEMPYGQLAVSSLKGKPLSMFVILLLAENHYSSGKSKKKFEYIAEWHNTAKYIAFCEGDDYWIEPQKLQKQIDVMEANPKIGLCYAQCRYFYQDTQRMSTQPWGGDSTSFDEFMKSNKVPSPTVVYRMDLFQRYSEEIVPDKKWLLGDYPMWIFFSHESQVSFLPIVTSIYRVLSTSASHTQSSKEKIRFSMSHIDVIEFFNKKYGYIYTDADFEGMRWHAKLRSYAIYNEVGKFLSCWLLGVFGHPSYMLNKSAYKYFLFFFVPKFRNTRK